jgi:hypothetical protein
MSNRRWSQTNGAQTREQFEQVLMAAHRGEIRDAELLRRCARRIRTLAESVYKDWRKDSPAWVDAEDVYQVMCQHLLTFVRRYEAGKGSSIRGYVVWNIVDKAEKAIHKWRGANLHGASGRAPSRFEVPLSAFDRDGEDENGGISTLVVTRDEARQEQHAEAMGFFDAALASSTSLPDALSILALKASGGSLVRAVGILYDDPSARLECGLMSEEDAGRLLRHTLNSLVIP